MKRHASHLARVYAAVFRIGRHRHQRRRFGVVHLLVQKGQLGLAEHIQKAVHDDPSVRCGELQRRRDVARALQLRDDAVDCFVLEQKLVCGFQPDSANVIRCNR